MMQRNGQTAAGSVPHVRRSTAEPDSTAAQAEPGGPTDGGRPAKPKRSIWFSPSIVNAKLIYAGYLASLAMPFLAIVAALFAFQSSKLDPPEWLATHYTYQIRTFWIGLVANLIAWALAFVGIGLLMFPLIAVWVVARAVNGLIQIARRDPISDPKSYFV